jgi:hypothetical protein
LLKIFYRRKKFSQTKKYPKNAVTEMQERAEKDVGKDVDLNMERNEEMILW